VTAAVAGISSAAVAWIWIALHISGTAVFRELTGNRPISLQPSAMVSLQLNDVTTA
jgi:hypothetical protein